MQKRQQDLQSIEIDKFLSMDIEHQLQIFEENDYPEWPASEEKSMVESQILPSKKEENFSTTGSKKEKSKQATAKYRERKKQYAKELEGNVHRLHQQIKQTEKQIHAYKNKIVTKLQATRMSGKGNENVQIFTELKDQVMAEEDYDIDKINLLLDTLKYRIGASGKERQAKINYFFKNIINTLFPALHRYLLISASKSVDVFQEERGHEMQWTQQLYNKMELTQFQKAQFQDSKAHLRNMYESSLYLIRRLSHLKHKLKEEQLVVDNIEDRLRECLSAVQCGRWTIFCQKHKYKEEIFLDRKFIGLSDHKKSIIINEEDEMADQDEFFIRLESKSYGRKIVKKDLS